MMAYSFVAVALLCALGVHAGDLTPKDVIDTIKIESKDVDAAFEGLDVKKDQSITQDDLTILYYHKDAEFAKKKFSDMIDKPEDKDKDVNKNELKAFLEKPQVTLAVSECKYIPSNVNKKHCFADQVCKYVFIDLDEAAVNSFFSALDSKADKNDKINLDDVTKVLEKFPEHHPKAAEDILSEIGNDDKVITKKEFEDYIKQEEVLGKFRSCRKKFVEGGAEYDNDCLIGELFHYVKAHVTEKDLAKLFIKFDNNKNKFIKADELAKTSLCEADVAEKFVKLMDKTKDGQVSYGEFRAYAKSAGVNFALAQCNFKIKNPEEHDECYKDVLLKHVKDNHRPNWLAAPELDLIFLFEDLDHTDDGKIHAKEDLVEKLSWKAPVADKLVKEIAQWEKQGFIRSYRFVEYAKQKHVGFAIGVCMEKGRCDATIKCYGDRLKELFVDVLTKQEAMDFFDQFYDTDKTGYITKKEVEAKGTKGELADFFLRQVGEGDDDVSRGEFLWFVRQLALSKLFAKCTKNEEKHDAIVNYLKTKVTEYQIKVLFETYDKDGDWELEESDFDDKKQFTFLLEKTDKNNDNVVVLREFWLFLNTPVTKPPKGDLETACADKFGKKEPEEVKCFKTEIFKLK